MIHAFTKSADDTRELGAALAAVTRPGDLILLAGDLGAGKTTLSQGFARALGVEQQVTSPTFVLMHHYQGRLKIIHADLYRLDHLQEVIDLGLLELLDEGAVGLVEWGEQAEPVLPADFCEVRLEFDDGDDERNVRFRLVGSSWAARRGALEKALDRWRTGEGAPA